MRLRKPRLSRRLQRLPWGRLTLLIKGKLRLTPCSSLLQLCITRCCSPSRGSSPLSTMVSKAQCCRDMRLPEGQFCSLSTMRPETLGTGAPSPAQGDRWRCREARWCHPVSQTPWPLGSRPCGRGAQSCHQPGWQGWPSNT